MAREFSDMGTPVFAPGPDTTDDVRSGWGGDGTDHRREYRRVLSASTLAGDRVRNSAGEDLGKIEEIMLDISTGRIAYAVLSFGGFLGMGDKLFAVPWDALTLDEREHEFILNVDKKQLEDAPGFDKDNWPDMANPAWGSQVYNYYGSKPYWQNGADLDETEAAPDRDRSRTLSGGGGL
jgi:sporulation protein YlmC with PRC-barrel domain